ncbi:MAG: iron uptake protein [Acidovorax sp.]|uniref:iron uptake protein n=1 Tax=Acidovorax sp. TaxID=1872122 RepID=UPI003918B6CB
MHPGLVLSLRVIGAVFGGYAFSAAWVAFAATALPMATGIARSEAVLLSSMLGFLVYLVVLIWAFAEGSVWRVWGLCAGGSVLAVALTFLVKARW